jgi:peptidyl-prolyl cis-trans isomerase C
MKHYFSALLLGAVTLAFGQNSTTVPVPLGNAPSTGPKPTVTLSTEAPPAPPTLPNVPPDRVVITVGDEKITAKEYDQIVDALPEQYRQMARSTARKQFAENLVRMKVLAKEGRRQKIDQDPKYKAQMAFNAENILAGLAVQRIQENTKLDEAAVRKYYDDHRAEYERVHARHILVRMKGSPVPVNPGDPDRTEEDALAKAQTLRKKLAGGANFDELAKAESDDTGSRPSGGDLGFFQHGQMVPSFEQAAFSLKPGEISDPVKSPFGYHIIKVEQKENKTFEELKPEIEKRLKPEASQKAVEALKAQTNIALDPEFFGLDKLEKK